MPGMWPQLRVPSIEVAFRYTILHSSPFNPHTRFLEHLAMGVLGSRIDPLRPLAERRRRSPLHPTTRQNRDLNLQPSLVMHLLLDS